MKEIDDEQETSPLTKWETSMKNVALTVGLICILFAITFSHLSRAANADDTAQASEFIRQMGDKALSSLTAKELPADERSQRVRSLLRENFNIHAIGRFVMGTHWKDATESQRTEYMNLFEDMIVRTYTQRFADYSGESFQVTGASAAGKSGDSIVNSVIQQKNGAPPINVDWRVHSEDGQMKIIDVVVDNISMSVTQRADFDSIIQQGGGKVEALLSSLRDKKS